MASTANNGSPLACSNSVKCVRTSCSFAMIVGSRAPVPAAALLESVELDGALVEGAEVDGAAEEASPSRRFNDSSATLYLLLQSVCAVANALKSLMKFATAVRCSPWSCCAAGSLVNSASD